MGGRCTAPSRRTAESLVGDAAGVMPRPKAPLGLKAAELKKGLVPLLPEDPFPGGAKAGWWLKSVQLDLEAKGSRAHGSFRNAGLSANWVVSLERREAPSVRSELECVTVRAIALTGTHRS